MNNVSEKKESSQQIATLGDGQVFLKKTAAGAIKAVKAPVTLEEKKGQLAVIQDKCTITAAGYYEMNKIAGVSVLTPDKLTLPDGSMVVNPYPIIDKESGSISKVWVKKYGIGYSPTGNLAITSSTLLYDIKMYFIQDLVKKIKYNKNAGKLCMESMLSDEEKKTGIFLPFEGPLGVWANYSDKDVLTALETFIQNKLFAERKAQTVAERNVLKKHPALAQTYVQAQGPDKNHVAKVAVVGYTHDLTQEDLFRLEKMIEKGEDISDYKGIKVEMGNSNSIDDVEFEDIVTSVDEEEEIQPSVDPKQAAPQPNNNSFSNNSNNSFNNTQPGTSQPDESKESSRKEVLKEEVNEFKNIIGEAKFNKIIQDNFRKTFDQLTIGQLEMAKKLINSTLDKGDDF